MPTHAFTISKLADAAGVNIETIRYYQRRKILDEPARVAGGFRAYSQDDLRRLQFIRRALDLGFSLDDAAELLGLSQSADRHQLRTIARMRADEIRERATQLVAMADALERLAETCAHTGVDAQCPIVGALTSPPGTEDAECMHCAIDVVPEEENAAIRAEARATARS